MPRSFAFNFDSRSAASTPDEASLDCLVAMAILKPTCNLSSIPTSYGVD